MRIFSSYSNLDLNLNSANLTTRIRKINKHITINKLNKAKQKLKIPIHEISVGNLKHKNMLKKLSTIYIRNIEIGRFQINAELTELGKNFIKCLFFLSNKINIAKIRTKSSKHKLSPKLLR